MSILFILEQTMTSSCLFWNRSNSWRADKRRGPWDISVPASQGHLPPSFSPRRGRTEPHSCTCSTSTRHRSKGLKLISKTRATVTIYKCQILNRFFRGCLNKLCSMHYVQAGITISSHHIHTTCEEPGTVVHPCTMDHH